MSAVPPGRRRDGTEWVSIEHSDDGGYFLYRRRRRDDAPDAESWHPTLDRAMREAEEMWGIGRGCWTVE